MAAPTQTPPAAPGRQPFMKGSIIWQKKGPLPVWAWALLLLGVLLAWHVWRKNKASAETEEAALSYVDELPGDQTSGPVFIVPTSPPPPVNVTVPVTTVPAAPPGGGRPSPPTTPGPAPKPVPKSPGRFVTVTKYPDTTPPRESTLWDIAASHLGKGELWPRIWNDPRNAQVKAKRGKPEKIRAGDKFFVPGAK